MDEKIQQILQALQMREEKIKEDGSREVYPTVQGDDRQKLVAELVKLLTE